MHKQSDLYEGITSACYPSWSRPLRRCPPLCRGGHTPGPPPRSAAPPPAPLPAGGPRRCRATATASASAGASGGGARAWLRPKGAGALVPGARGRAAADEPRLSSPAAGSGGARARGELPAAVARVTRLPGRPRWARRAALPWGAVWVGAPRPPAPPGCSSTCARRCSWGTEESRGGGGRAALGAGGVPAPPGSPGDWERGGVRARSVRRGSLPLPAAAAALLALVVRPWAWSLPRVLACCVLPPPSRPGFGAWGFVGLQPSPKHLLP